MLFDCPRKTKTFRLGFISTKRFCAVSTPEKRSLDMRQKCAEVPWVSTAKLFVSGQLLTINPRNQLQEVLQETGIWLVSCRISCSWSS